MRAASSVVIGIPQTVPLGRGVVSGAKIYATAPQGRESRRIGQPHASVPPRLRQQDPSGSVACYTSSCGVLHSQLNQLVSGGRNA